MFFFILQNLRTRGWNRFGEVVRWEGVVGTGGKGEVAGKR
jgi:hypothetical protein